MFRLASLVALLSMSLVLAACGSSGGAADADPATAVPRDALLYLEATVRPEGQQREDALAAAGKVLQTPDPEAKLREWLDSSSEDFDYERDLAPWLGERGALWMSSRTVEGDDRPGLAAVIAATDLEEAEGAIEEAQAREKTKTTERSHAGVDYKVDADGFAYAFEGDFVLAGDEPELKQTIDALEGESLADEDRYKQPVDALDGDRLAHVWMDTRRLFELGMKADPEAAQQFEQLKGIFDFEKLPPAAAAFVADGSRLAIDGSIEIPEDVQQQPFGSLMGVGSTALLEELPGDSWAAQGAPKFGQTMKLMFNQAAGAFGGGIAQEQLRSQLGIDLERDVFSWVGDVAFFVRGETLDSVDGGAVIQVTDEAAAADAFGRLVGVARSRGQVDARPVDIEGADTAFAAALPEAPKPIVMARSADKVVITYGQEAATAALSGSDTLGDSELYGRTRDVLGDGLDPSFLIAVGPIVSLVDSSGTADASWNEFKPYLEAFDLLAVGGGTDGDTARFRIAAGLRD